MKILIFGAGVIGSIVGWQLQGRNDVTHFVKSDKLSDYNEHGICIDVCDLRKNDSKISSHLYQPNFIDSLDNISEYDVLLLSVKSNQLIDVIQQYQDEFNKIPIFIMQNVGLNDYNDITHLLSHNVSFLYPFIMGGGRVGNKINCTIFNSFMNSMVIGNLDNAKKDVEIAIYDELKHCQLHPTFSKDIKAYLKLHYVWATCSLASYIHSGNYDNFSKIHNIQDSYKAMLECFAVFKKEGIDSKKIFPYNIYHLPSFILAISTQMLYKTEAMKIMIMGHINSSPDEMESMYDSLYEYCQDNLDNMPIFKSYKVAIDNHFKR